MLSSQKRTIWVYQACILKMPSVMVVWINEPKIKLGAWKLQSSRLKAAGLVVSGKTGTAQVRALKRDKDGRPVAEVAYEGRDHAWFAGYAPAEDPVVAVAVLVEHGGSGGRAAAPIAFEIMASVLVPEDEG